jgi:Major Facilitator Superfamily
MRSALRSNSQLRRLLGAWLQSCLGTGAGYVALLLLAVRLHSAWILTLVLLADFLPAIGLGAWFGSLADRYSRRLLIVAGNLLQAGAYFGLVYSHRAVPIIALALLAGIGNALQRPALRSALPLIAGEVQQAAAAWFDTCRWVGITVGPLLAAGLFVVSGVGLPLALNGLSFLLAAAVIGTLPADSVRSARAERHGAADAGRSNLRAALALPGIAGILGCSSGIVIAGGILNVCEPLLATGVLHGSGSDYALLVACYGVGMVTATVLVARRGDAGGRTLIGRYVAALLLSALGMEGSAISSSIGTATVAFAATGYANALLVVSETQLIQLRVPNAVQGRVFGLRDMVEGAFFLAGLVGASALVAAGGVRFALGSGAVACGFCLLAAAALLYPLRDRGSDAVGEVLLEVPLASGEVAGDGVDALITRRFDPDAPGAAAAVPAEVADDAAAVVHR